MSRRHRVYVIAILVSSTLLLLLLINNNAGVKDDVIIEGKNITAQERNVLLFNDTHYYQGVPLYENMFSDVDVMNLFSNEREFSPLSPGQAILLTIKRSRTDRMGSRINYNLAAWLIARYHEWQFCVPEEEMAKSLSFPICSELGYTPELLKDAFTYAGVHNIQKEGIYSISCGSKPLWNVVHNVDIMWSNNNNTYLTDGAIGEWKRMILKTPVRPELDKVLWKKKDSLRIAVHVRRGDILPGKRNDLWTDDDIIICQIEMSMWYIRETTTRPIEVHVFSENYGATNWSRYENLVDEFHLASEVTDVHLNFRDWKHFVLADVLITSHTFSQIPALARGRPSLVSGLPMTLMWNAYANRAYRDYWIQWKRKRISPGIDEIYFCFPNHTITAYLGFNPAHLKVENEIPIQSIIHARYGYNSESC